MVGWFAVETCRGFQFLSGLVENIVVHVLVCLLHEMLLSYAKSKLHVFTLDFEVIFMSFWRSDLCQCLRRQMYITVCSGVFPVLCSVSVVSHREAFLVRFVFLNCALFFVKCEMCSSFSFCHSFKMVLSSFSVRCVHVLLWLIGVCFTWLTIVAIQ